MSFALINIISLFLLVPRIESKLVCENSFYPEYVLNESVFNNHRVCEIRCYMRESIVGTEEIDFYLTQRLLFNEIHTQICELSYKRGDSLNPVQKQCYSRLEYLGNLKIDRSQVDNILFDSLCRVVSMDILTKKGKQSRHYWYNSFGMLDSAYFEGDFGLHREIKFQYRDDGLPFQVIEKTYMKESAQPFIRTVRYQYILKSS